MLDSLRSAASTWVAKLLLGLLVLSFAVWGISGSVFDNQTNTVLTAGESTVSTLDYRLAYDRRINALSQRLGQRVTREQAVSFGLDDQVLQQLAAGALLDEEARHMGLGLSRDELAALTAEDPAFRGAGGQFDRRQFDFVLSQIGMRPEDYLRNREQVAIRQQIVEAATDGIAVPDALLRNVARYRGEDRTIEYVAVPRSLVEPIEPPDGGTLQSWFDERKADYAAPEYRKFSYVKLEPSDLADPAAISDEQVRQVYEERRDQYTTPERRAIDQLTFSARDEAAAALEDLLDGKSFDDVVAEQGKTAEDIDLGMLSRAEVPDDAVAEAAFALEEDQFSSVVESAFGPVILRVGEIQPERVRPLEEVESELRRQLALEEASRILLDVHDSYEDLRAGGATMAEAADELGLTLRTVDAVDSQGLRPDGTRVADLPQPDALLREVFATDANIENPPLSIGANGFLFYEVESVTPAHERDLEEVREDVEADWIEAEAEQRLGTRAGELAQQLRDGKALDAIAAEIDQEKQIKRGLKRTANDADIGQAGVTAAFSVPEGGTGVFANPAGDGRFLFQVTEVFEPASVSAESVPERERQAMQTALSNDLLDQMVARLQSKYSVSVNRAAMQQALSF